MVLYTGYQRTNMDWATALTDMGLSIPIGDSQVSILCPFHEDTTESCSINVEKGVWICFAGCGQGHLKGFIADYKGWSYQQVRDYLDNYKGNYKDDLFDFTMEEEDKQLPEVTIPYTLGAVPPWIFNRDFTKASMKKWRCGVTGRNGLVLPMLDKDERAVGWAIRQEKIIPKYLYSRGLQKSKILFGQHLITPSQTLCVTEGPLDTMWLDQLGFKSVAILGAIMSRRQQELLLTLPVKEIILCLDNDKAGTIGRNKALDMLRGKIALSYIKIPSEYKDVQDIRSYDILQNVINNRQYW